MLRVMYKSLLAHRGRMLLTAISVLLGVSLVSGTYVVTDTMTAVFDDLMGSATAGIDVYVRGETTYEQQINMGGGREPVSQQLLYAVRGIDGVDMAYGSVAGFASLLDKKGDVIRHGASPTLGFSWSPPPLSPVQISVGDPPLGDDDIAIDALTAEEQGLEVGDSVKVVLDGPARRFEIVGIATFGEANNLAGATMSIFSLRTAQEVFDKVAVFDAIEISAEEGVTASELRRKISAILPEGYEAVEGTTVARESTDAIHTMLGYFNTALLVFALIALFVGAFIIFNTFSIIVAQRMREFALLRALGAAPRQVMLAIGIEALIVGVIASVIGVFGGLAVATGLQSLLDRVGMGLPDASMRLLPRTVVVSMILGVGVTIFSAVFPAIRAGKVSPLAVMRESDSTARPLTRRLQVGGAMFTVGLAALLMGLFADMASPLMFVGFGALLMFLGAAALSPMFTRRFVRIVGVVPARVSNVAGSLARENARRAVRRTATTASALMVGVALVCFVAIFSSSIKASIRTGLERSVKADFVISETSGMAALGFSPGVATAISQMDEVDVVSPIRTGEFGYEGSPRFVTGVDPDSLGAVVDIEVLEGELSDLGSDGVFLERPVAESLGVGVGDALPMEFSRAGKVDASVVGIFDNTSALTGEFVISLTMFEDVYTDIRDARLYISAAQGHEASAVRSALEAEISRFAGLEVLDKEGLLDSQSGQIDQMMNLVTALLGLALIIAVIGIANTLGLSVLERTRELGLLRAVGMSRRQLRTMIRWEAVMIAFFGACLGLGLGAFFGWSVAYAMGDSGITHISLPVTQLAIYLVIGTITGVIAAIVPARRAARLDILRAITVE